MKKSLLITNIPAHYRVDLFNELSIEPNHDIHFLFIPDKTVHHKKGLWSCSKDIFWRKAVLLSNRSFFLNFIYLFKCLLRNKFDNIIIGGIPRYFPLLVLSKLAFRTKIICWWAGNQNTENISFFKLKYRNWFSGYIDSFLFYSKSAFEYINFHIRKIDVPYTIIGNNTRLSETELKKIDYIGFRKKDGIRIISVGFQEKRKNTVLLLQALLILQQQNYKITTVIVGDGPLLPILKRFSVDNKLQNVEFLGNLTSEEVYREMLRSDILVHPSISDSWPQVVNEASFCGLAVILSDKSGVESEYTERYKDEVLFDTKKEILASKIKKIIDNPALLAELKEASFEWAKANDGQKIRDIFFEILQ